MSDETKLDEVLNQEVEITLRENQPATPTEQNEETVVVTKKKPPHSWRFRFRQFTLFSSCFISYSVIFCFHAFLSKCSTIDPTTGVGLL